MTSPSPSSPRAFTVRRCLFHAVPPFVALALAAGLAGPAAAATGAEVSRTERDARDEVAGTATPPAATTPAPVTAPVTTPVTTPAPAPVTTPAPVVTPTTPAPVVSPTAPAAVRSLKAKASSSSITLTWSKGAEKDLAGYRVYRSATAEGGYALIATTTSAKLTDKSAPAGSPSHYRVTAVDTAGEESAASTVHALRRDGTAPAAPGGLTATAGGDRIALDWADSPEADLAGYVVARATGTSSSYQVLTATPLTASAFSDASAVAGAAYTYRVTAVDLSGNDSPASSTRAVLPDALAPAAVRSPKAKGSTSGITLSWSRSRESDLAGYRVQRATSPQGPWTPIATTTSTELTDKTAPAGVFSHYRITAVDTSGNESAPVTVSALREDRTAPAAPVTLGAVVTADGIALDWADSPEADLAGYVVLRATGTSTSFKALTGKTLTASAYTDTTAVAGTRYTYRVAVVDLSGNTSAPAAVTAAVPDTLAPVAVRSLKAKTSSTSIKLSWSRNGEGDLAGYRVYRASAVGGEHLLLATTTSTSYTDASAPAGVFSHYRVTAVDASGNESAPAAVSALREDSTAPAAPAALVATDTGNGLALTWTASPEADLDGYVVQRATGSSSSFTTLTPALLREPGFTDTTAVAGTSYTYRVRAVDLSGNLSAPGSVTALRADTVPPAAPTGLGATGVAGGVQLRWSANAERDLAGYRVFRVGADGGLTALTAAPLTATAYLDATAPAGVVSTYVVTALDAGGNQSPASASAGAAPADTTAPATPTGLSATADGAGTTLAWAASPEADLAGYLVFRAATAGGPWTQLTPAPLTGLTHVDATAPAGVVSHYRLAAVDTAGNVSASTTAQALRPAVLVPVPGADVTVAADGTGDHTTVAAALAAAPAAATTPFVIGIRPGTYREVLTVDKPGVTLLGSTGNAADVVITYDNAAGTRKADGTTYGTSGSATVLIKSNGVTAKNLTIENSYVETGTGSEQAVALKTTGDKLVFDNVRLLGDQDTLYADSPRAGALARSYYVNSYVEGDVDFIFGRGTVVFDRSTIKAATRGSSSNNGYVTAPSTDRSLTHGYLITDSTITSDAPAGTFSLGRPWQPSGDVNAVGQVVVRNTELPAAVKATPWTDFGTSLWRNARFSEYRNTGAGAAVNADRPQLSDLDAAKHTKFTYLAGPDGWNPTGETAPADTTAPAAVAGLSAQASDSSVALAWTAGTETDLAGYVVYRSTGDTVELTAANRIATGITGTSYTDRTAANGATYRYAVTAVDASGNESPASATVTAAPVGVPLPAHDVLVAADGTGQYTSVQAALAAAKAGTAARPTVIAVKPGVYEEMITISSNHVTLVGTTGTASDVVLTYDNAAGTTIPGGTATYGTGKSQSVLVSGSGVTVKDLTIENSFRETGAPNEQAVALKTTGDRLVFDNVRLLGNQDTLLVDSPDAPVVARSYFVNSYVEGDVDFIFGRGTAVFDRTTIHALSRGSSSNNGYVTAASTSDKNPHGFLITDSTITSDAPAGTFSLGRPWRGWSDGYTKDGTVYNSRGQVTIRNTELPAAVRAVQPWAAMSSNPWTDGRFFEYGNTGAGATQNANRPQLTDAQAATATKWAYLAGSDGWNPTGQTAPTTAPAPTTPPAPTTGADTTAPSAPTALSRRLGKSTVTLTWSAPSDTDVAGYAVHRSSGSAAAVEVARSVTGSTFTDTTATPGTAYRYTVTAVDVSGNASPASAPVTATPVKADVVVAADGSGDATTLQGGIDALANNADYTTQGGRTILVQPGTYTGVATSGNRYGVTIVGAGASASDTVITAGGTGATATLTLAGKGWTLRNLTLANTNGVAAPGAQATALQVKSGDRMVFEGVRFLGDGQTLQLSTANPTTYSRSYFRDVYVEGGADLLIGRAVAVFEASTFHVLDRPGASLTDSSVAAESPYGFLITGSRVLTDGRAASVHLGRPYGTQGKAQVVVRESELGAAITATRPWKDWDATTTWTAGRFAEYRNTGAGAAVVDPATRPQLSDADAERFTARAYLAGSDGWNPTAG